MITEKENTRVSKFLSLVLRHKPEEIDIELDADGWVDVNVLLEKLKLKGFPVDRQTLDHVVSTNSKKRFAYNDAGDKIRASQGHSLEVQIIYEKQTPPKILYHGTSESSVASILQTGLEKRSRQYVHLSGNVQTAEQVGSRHGKPFIFTVKAEEMFYDGLSFYLSENGVWLTDFVPVKYLHPQKS